MIRASILPLTKNLVTHNLNKSKKEKGKKKPENNS
jgi:hypothetical protein